LRGQRLNGRFHLVKLRRRERERQDTWWLIKGHDEYERPGVDASTIEAETPLHLDAKPHDNANAAPPAPGAKRSAMPKRQEPQLAQLVEDPPEDEGWLSEIKLDGYRLLVWLEDGRARLVTRNGHDWTPRLPRLAATFSGLRAGTALLDGEMVALRPDGISSFHDLQAALSEGRDGSLFFYVFDLLHLDGWDLRSCRLIDRKRVLSGLSDWRGTLRYSDHVEGDPAPMRREACRLGLEGIICKRADAPYRPGRGHGWLKVKVPRARGVCGARVDAAGRLTSGSRLASGRLLRSGRQAALRRGGWHRLYRTRT
jgi:bifunctional non-homologous end joining protein LigD